LENGELTAISLSGTLYSVSTGSVLPLQLLQWNGAAYDNYNQLNWQTADEKNVNQFEVEFSTDGITFINTATISAKNEIHATYTFRHFMETCLMYYRLKMVNLDGSIEYSGIISIKNNSLKKLQVMHSYNGNTKMIWLNIPATGKAAFQLFDLNGSTLIRIDHYQNNAVIDLQKLPTGLYVGKIILADKIISEKILVQ
jgi:hypothetical protein